MSCPDCDGLGYTTEISSIGRGKFEEDDFGFRDVPCECPLGSRWLSRVVNIAHDQATAINKFIDDNHEPEGSQRRSYERSIPRLLDLWFDGRRDFKPDGGRKFVWSREACI